MRRDMPRLQRQVLLAAMAEADDAAAARDGGAGEPMAAQLLPWADVVRIAGDDRQRRQWWEPVSPGRHLRP